MEETSVVKETEFGRGITIYLEYFYAPFVTTETDKTEGLGVLCFMLFQLSNNRKLSLNA